MSKVIEVLKKIASKITYSKVIMFLILCFFAALGISYLNDYFLKDYIQAKKAEKAEPVYEEEYGDKTMVIHENYLINNQGKIVDVRDIAGRDQTYTGYTNEIQSDYFQDKALVYDGKDKVYLFNSDLEYEVVAEKACRAGMSLSGNKVFYIIKKPSEADNEVYIYDVETKETNMVWKGASEAVLSPEGNYLLYYVNKEDCLYSVNFETGKSKVVTKNQYIMPLSISDEGKYIFGYRGDGNGKIEICYIEKDDIWGFGYSMSQYDYNFVVMSKQQKDIFCSMRSKDYYFNGETGYFHKDFLDGWNAYIPFDYTVRKVGGQEIMILSNEGFDDFVYKYKGRMRCITETKERVYLFDQYGTYLFSGYEDGVFTAYAIDGNYKIDKAIVTYVEGKDGELETKIVHDKSFLSDYNIRTMRTNEKHNMFYFVTTDFKLYCYDGNNDETKFICNMEDSGASVHNHLEYSKFEDILYFVDGDDLFSYDPETEKITLVTGDCYMISGGDHKTDLVQFCTEEMEENLYVVNGQIFKPTN
ncbi:hypothetical protein [Butyrivibrio sp. VCB2006]|uniref:hypothetical protein n=1 Tax=Butyrivibrio sp. VCB2006 TaxID=1280679 RepID=UPI000492CE47|nr:hypothetical protein [Butyrivibrio sp. VCB2006]